MIGMETKRGRGDRDGARETDCWDKNKATQRDKDKMVKVIETKRQRDDRDKDKETKR